jgi:hypothetical protein
MYTSKARNIIQFFATNTKDVTFLLFNLINYFIFLSNKNKAHNRMASQIINIAEVVITCANQACDLRGTPRGSLRKEDMTDLHYKEFLGSFNRWLRGSSGNKQVSSMSELVNLLNADYPTSLIVGSEVYNNFNSDLMEKILLGKEEITSFQIPSMLQMNSIDAGNLQNGNTTSGGRLAISAGLDDSCLVRTPDFVSALPKASGIMDSVEYSVFGKPSTDLGTNQIEDVNAYLKANVKILEDVVTHTSSKTYYLNKLILEKNPIFLFFITKSLDIEFLYSKLRDNLFEITTFGKSAIGIEDNLFGLTKGETETRLKFSKQLSALYEFLLLCIEIFLSPEYESTKSQ